MFTKCRIDLELKLKQLFNMEFCRTDIYLIEVQFGVREEGV